MKVYTAALINKPSRRLNRELGNKISSELKNAISAKSSQISTQELNTFLFVSGTRNGHFNPDIVEKVEKGKLKRIFNDYYKKNESRFQRYLKKNQELHETSQIIKNFVQEIEPRLGKRLGSNLEKLHIELPKEFRKISSKSFITVWDMEEIQEYRFFLSGFDFPFFTGYTQKNMKIDSLVDKLLIINFFMNFLTPSLQRFINMKSVLVRLEDEIKKTHYRSSDERLQEKFELFLRILVAKLSALEEVDNQIYRIFNLFEIPKMIITQYNLKSDFQDINTTIATISDQINEGKTQLHELSELIQRCQKCFRDYLDETVNGVKIAESTREFITHLKSISRISIDLFVEAESLKMWSDFFGSDIPFFSFNVQLIDQGDEGPVNIDKDVILAVRGLFKNYNLGRNTVYALRGVNLDIKEGEFVAIVGSSGAGKTTLLNCMASLDSPDHGNVYFRGKDLHKMKDSEKSEVRLKHFGFIFQSYALLPHFNTKENIALPADLAGRLNTELKKRIEGLLRGVGIDQQAGQFPAQLSGGQMQRVAIARALTNQPSIIFADEPTGDLDSVTGTQVMELLKNFHEHTKTTIVIITHEQDIAAYAQRQILMEDGIISKH
ncbi:ABC transporter ATP-binding protein [Candidatus Hodarchaeum mangrovi]